MCIPAWFVRSVLFLAAVGGATFGFADNAAALSFVEHQCNFLPYPFGMVLGVACAAIIPCIIIKAVYDLPS